MRPFRSRKSQRGVALVVMATVLIMGFAWYAIGALNNALPSEAEREAKTGVALQEAKKAFLAHVAQYAARSDTAEPGQLPCPESLNLTNEGQASGSCGNVLTIGRLPWKTLGIDQIRDGYGEPLWLAISPGFRTAPINFDTVGQLTWNGSANSAVAVIMAPGRVLNTTPVAGTPPAGCSAMNQGSAMRTAVPLDPALFLECGNATSNFRNLGSSAWTNDRAIAITQAEWADAIAGPVADRLQRQVAPAMESFRTTTSNSSWGQSFLPNASTIDAGISGSQPENNNMCGNAFPVVGDPRVGMPPTATVASGLCSTNWSTGSAFGVPLALTFGGCSQTGSEMRCTFVVAVGGILSPWLTVTAPRVGYAFRAFDPSSITVELNGVPTAGIVRNYSDTVSAADGSATIQFELNLPFLAVASVVTARIPNATDALLADTRSAWFINNSWDRHTYYGVSPAATHDTDGAVCNPGGTVTGCLNVFGMPAPTNDKRLVLVLMGRPRAGTTQPSYTLTNYLEDQNATPGINYDVKTVSSAFNDRVAACPYRYYDTDGTTILLQPC